MAVRDPLDGRNVCIEINEPISVHISGLYLRCQNAVCDQLESCYNHTANNEENDENRRTEVQFRNSILFILNL